MTSSENQQLFTNFWCSFGRSIVEIKTLVMTESTQKNTKRLYFFFISHFVTSSCNVFKSSRHFPSSARVCKCCDSSTEIHVFFPTIILLFVIPCYAWPITGVCVWVMWARGAQHLLWPGVRRSQMPRSSPRGEVSGGFK